MAAPIPYLGSKISLVSKSEIRYEGILYTIDAEQSIIALAKVQSFGTEDRPTEMPVPARSEIYEYIIFKGSDLKKVEVCEPPKLQDDPAIVQHSAPTLATSLQPSYSRPLGPIGGGLGAIGGLGISYNYGQPLAQSTLSSSGGFNLAPTSQPSELFEVEGIHRMAKNERVPDPGPIGSSSRPIPTPIGPPSSTNKEVIIGSRASTPTRKSPVSDCGVQVSPPAIQQEMKVQPQRNLSGGPQPPYRGNQRRGQNNYYQGQRPNQNYQGQRPNQNYQGYYNNNQYYSNRGQMGRGRPRRPQLRGRGPMYNQGNRPRQDPQIFDKEFDFEQANEEFEELRTQLSKTKISDTPEKKEDSGHETTTTADDSEDSTTCYDKEKSFFDSISCEAIERSKGRSQRPDWRHERKLNVQTFGVATARRSFYPRGRGGYYNYRRNYSQGGYYRSGNPGYRGGRGGYMEGGSNNQNMSGPSGNQNTVNSYASAARAGTASA